jgi:hypothetical protein
MALRKAVLAALAALAFAIPASAHHSNAMYDPNAMTSVDGTVKEFNFTNPHSWIYVTVTDDSGAEIDWALETSSTRSLMERGWTPQTLNPGDRISATFRPMRDGSPGGELQSITLADGRTIE